MKRKLYQVIYWTLPKRGAYAFRFVNANSKAEAAKLAGVKYIAGIELVK